MDFCVFSHPKIIALRLPFPILLFVFCSFGACKSDPPVKKKIAIEPSKALEVSVGPQALLDKPTPNGTVVTQLAKGSTVEDLNEVSTFNTLMNLQGKELFEPWLKVRTENEQIGWVYAGALTYKHLSSEENDRQKLENRALGLLGEAVYKRIVDYKLSFNSIQNLEEFIQTWNQGIRIRENLQEQLATQLSELPNIPDCFWLEDLLPGFIIHFDVNQRQYFIFADFSKWGEQAIKTSKELDNAFVDLAFQVYAVDSIEYVDQAWLLPVEEQHTYSLLGNGIHVQILQDIIAFEETPNALQSIVSVWKEALIQDICDPGQAYWMDHASILEEVDRVLALTLSTNERKAIQERRTQFLDAEKNGIPLNYRSGKY